MKKKKARTEVNVTKLSASEKKARAKKLEYNNLKTKLVRQGLWKEYLAAKKSGEAERGESMDLMRQMAGEGPVFKRVPKDGYRFAKPKPVVRAEPPATHTLLELARMLDENRKQAIDIKRQIQEVLQ